MKQISLVLCILFSFSLSAQINFSAQDQVPPYTNTFGFGINMGVYAGWNDQDLATIAAGSTSLGVLGAGCNTLRPTLPESFLEYWGYDIRVDAFQYYDQLGLRDNTVFIGYPSEEHRDPTNFCPGVQSTLFANMYTDIWDNGENGTPVNDENHYALYIYRMVNLYGPYTKFWEVWNEPDFDFSNSAEKAPGEPGNWWENVPEPCDYALRAPVFHYIRLLRITYEVIKTLDPDAYIAVGGIGFPSFLDIVLRHSDNPDGGAINADYPLTGGAYFDALSYHSYPHYDGSMRYWSNDAGGFVYTRHSDAAVDGLLRRRNELLAVMENYGYNGSTYPEKIWIITETNIPSASFVDEFYGSEIGQRNFTMKAVVQCQKNKISQLHLYKLGEDKPRDQANNDFDRMGLYENFGGVAKYDAVITPAGTAYRTLSQTIGDAYFDAPQTQALQLPNTIEGAAFRQPDGSFSYVLWAKTSVDRSEIASANYSFPANLGISFVSQKAWDHAATQYQTTIPAQNIPLTGDPVILTSTAPVSTQEQVGTPLLFKVTPNPITDKSQVIFQLEEAATVDLAIMDSQGKVVLSILQQQDFNTDLQQVQLPIEALPAGIYYAQIQTKRQRAIIKLVKQ